MDYEDGIASSFWIFPVVMELAQLDQRSYVVSIKLGLISYPTQDLPRSSETFVVVPEFVFRITDKIFNIHKNKKLN